MDPETLVQLVNVLCYFHLASAHGKRRASIENSAAIRRRLRFVGTMS
jgi:hypothetical protein